MAKPPFPWIGSKEKIAPYILQLFPPKLTQYVEPFGGSGAVLLALPPDPNLGINRSVAVQSNTHWGGRLKLRDTR